MSKYVMAIFIYWMRLSIEWMLIYWVDTYLLKHVIAIFVHWMYWYLSIECTQLPYYPHIFFGCSGATQNSMHLYKSPVVERGRFRHTSSPSRVWIFLYLFPTKHTSLSFTHTHTHSRAYALDLLFSYALCCVTRCFLIHRIHVWHYVMYGTMCTHNVLETRIGACVQTRRNITATPLQHHYNTLRLSIRTYHVMDTDIGDYSHVHHYVHRTFWIHASAMCVLLSLPHALRRTSLSPPGRAKLWVARSLFFSLSLSIVLFLSRTHDNTPLRGCECHAHTTHTYTHTHALSLSPSLSF